MTKRTSPRTKAAKATQRRKDFDELARLVAFFRDRSDAWGVGASGFEARSQLVGVPARGTIVYKIHVIGWDEPRTSMSVSLTIWPPASGKRRDSAAATRWRRECVKTLAGHGYKGRWHNSPWGKFGDFWKKLKGRKAFLAELKDIERRLSDPSWIASAAQRRVAANEARAS